MQDRLEHPPKHALPVCPAIGPTVEDIVRTLEPSRDPESRELLLLLRPGTRLRSLLDTHDAAIAGKQANGLDNDEEEDEEKRREKIRQKPVLGKMPSNEERAAEAVRIVGLRRQPDEPLVCVNCSCSLYCISINIYTLRYCILTILQKFPGSDDPGGRERQPNNRANPGRQHSRTTSSAQARRGDPGGER